MQTRSEHSRRRLVHAGAELFDRNGYAQATLGEIAASAGLTKGALYFHFASKDGLVDAIEERARMHLRDFVEGQRERGVPPVQSLIDLTHLLARTLHQEPVVRASFRIAHECAGRRPPVGDFHQPWIAQAHELLARARAEGALRERQPGEGIRSLLSALVGGIAVLAATRSPHLQLHRDVTGLWNQLLPTLVPAAAVGHYRTHPPETAAEAGTGTDSETVTAGPDPAAHDADRAPTADVRSPDDAPCHSDEAPCSDGMPGNGVASRTPGTGPRVA